MKKLLSFFAALCCCFALEAQEISYEPITALPSPIDPNAVYVLGYQVGNDYYLHTSGTTAGQMQLSKNPESPIEYKFTSMQIGTEIVIYSFANNYGSSASNYLHINTQGVSYGTFNPFSSTDPFSLSIVNGDISSASASGYTVCHDGDNIITVHTGTSEGNLRFFKSTSKPSYSIAVSPSPAGTGTATATVGGGQVESAIEGTNITVTATPASGYKFVNWTENGEEVSTANPYTFTLTTDRNLVANFVYIECVFRPGVYDMWSYWENWSNRLIPEPYDNITILGKCLLNVDATVSELRVAAGKTLTIGEGKTLTAVSIILENGAQLVNNGTVNCNAITLEDGARLVNNGTVTYNVMEITANQDPSHETDYYSTFYSSTNAHEVPDDVTAYTGVADGSVLTLTPVANGIIPAGEAVILRLTTNDNTAMTQQIQLTATTTTATKSTDNMLQGSDEPMTLPDNSYALSLGQKGVGFYDFSNVELPAHKAYLTYASGSAISLRFSFGDATDIDIIETEAPAKAYNLQGQQVDESYKGIVIVNGKKVLNN